MPVTVEVRLPDGRTLEIQFPSKPTPEQVQQAVEQILAAERLSAPKPAAPQPTQAQQLAQAMASTLRRGWNWLRGKLGIKSPQERAAEIAGPALAKHPEALQEMARIEAARQQATSLGGMLRDAAIAPSNLAAERRYGSALQRQGAQANTGSQMDQVGVVGQLGNILSLPQRGAVAWAKQIAQRHGARGSKYADAGEAFQDAAEWGALLEDLAPSLPKPVRLAMAVPMDILLDPLLLVPPAKVVQALAPIASKLPGAAKATELGSKIQFQALKWLHPTIASTLEQYATKWVGPDTPIIPPASQLVQRLRQALQLASEMSNRSIGDLVQEMPIVAPSNDPMAAAVKLSAFMSRLRDQLTWPQRAVRMTQRRAEQILANIDEELLQMIRAQSPEDFARAQQAIEAKLRASGVPDEIAQMVGQLAKVVRVVGEFQAEDAPERAAAIAEAVRRKMVDASDPGLWQRMLGWWKRSVTSLNLPAGAVRNFLGNFLAHYLANEPIQLSKRPLRELMQEAFSGSKFTRAGDIGADVLKRGEPPKQALARVAQTIADTAGEIYSGADKLAAAVLAKITDKPPTHFMISESFRLPERIEWLSRVGLVPFATWPTFIVPRLARGFMENPARWHRLGLALQSGGVQEKDNNLFKPLPGNRALNLEPFLPISPYMLSSSEGDLPELLQRWPPLAIARDITDALAGAPARPAALSTENPLINALITASNYALPPTFWNLLRLTKPEWFADIPPSPLTPQDYLLRLLGMGIIRNPEQYAVMRRRRELERLRRLMRRVGVRANQMNPDEEE